MLALRNLGVDAPADELSILFDTFDTDHGGSISYKELNKQLRAGADADLSQITVKDKFGNIIDVNLAAGAAGAIESRAELIARGAAVSHEARRKKGSAFHGSERLVASQESGSVQTQLRDILKENAVRVIDLFRDWDDDQSGTITFKEFRRAIGALGYEAPPDDLRAVFDSFDNDKGGTIELSELNKHLRRGADILLDPALRDGAAGEIVLESKNLNRRSLPEQLAVALAAKADADPRAALRRTGMALAGRPQSVLLQQRGSARLPQPAPQSPRSFQRAALLFAHHHATSKTATRFPSPRSPRHQLADPVLEAVERHERAQAQERIMGASSRAQTAPMEPGEHTRQRLRERREWERTKPPSERQLLFQLLGSTSEQPWHPQHSAIHSRPSTSPHRQRSTSPPRSPAWRAESPPKGSGGGYGVTRVTQRSISAMAGKGMSAEAAVIAAAGQHRARDRTPACASTFPLHAKQAASGWSAPGSTRRLASRNGGSRGSSPRDAATPRDAAPTVAAGAAMGDDDAMQSVPPPGVAPDADLADDPAVADGGEAGDDDDDATLSAPPPGVEPDADLDGDPSTETAEDHEPE